MMRYWNGGGWGWGWAGWVAMVLMMLIFWGAIAWVVVAVVRHGGLTSSESSRGEQPPDPLRILDERFARGEIDDDEYQRRREVLRVQR
jgi:putative membrane protein